MFSHSGITSTQRKADNVGDKKTKKWYEGFITAIGVNIWAPEWFAGSIRAFDAEKIAEPLARCGADVGLTFQGFSQDHFGVSYFPTELGHVHCNLSGRDHLGGYRDAVRAAGAKFFAYYCFQDRIVWDQYPDWRVRDRNAGTESRDNFGYLCPNSPYRDHVILRIGEIAGRYRPDGWLLDMLQAPLCYCDYCRRKYRLSLGLSLPETEPENSAEWGRFIRWRYDQLAELYREIVHTIKAVTPDAVITHNAFALWNSNEWASGEDHEALLASDDVTTNIFSCDCGMGQGPARDPELIWKAGYYTRVFRGLSEKPVWMQFGRFMYTRDYTVVSEHELELTAFSVVANGGCPAVIDNAFPDGAPDSVAGARISGVYRKINAKRQYLGFDSEPEFAALLYSKSSQDWFDVAFPGKGVYGYGFMGAYKALVETHVPFQAVSERTLTGERLGKFKVIILSDCAVLSDKTADMIAEYVRAGGTVIALGKTGVFRPDGESREDPLFAEVFGVRFKGTLNYATSFVSMTESLWDGFQPGYRIPLRECFPERFDITGSSRIVMSSVLPATETVPGKRVFTYADDVAPGARSEPFAVTNTYGGGKSVYFGGNIARIYGLYGYPELRSALYGAVAHCSEPPVKTDAPAFVEMSVFVKDGGRILHLLNYAGGLLRASHYTGGNTCEQAVPVYNLDISIKTGEDSPASVKLENGIPLQFSFERGWVRFSVPKLETHLLVIIK